MNPHDAVPDQGAGTQAGDGALLQEVAVLPVIQPEANEMFPFSHGIFLSICVSPWDLFWGVDLRPTVGFILNGRRGSPPPRFASHGETH